MSEYVDNTQDKIQIRFTILAPIEGFKKRKRLIYVSQRYFSLTGMDRKINF